MDSLLAPKCTKQDPFSAFGGHIHLAVGCWIQMPWFSVSKGGLTCYLRAWLPIEGGRDFFLVKGCKLQICISLMMLNREY